MKERTGESGPLQSTAILSLSLLDSTPISLLCNHICHLRLILGWSYGIIWAVSPSAVPTSNFFCLHDVQESPLDSTSSTMYPLQAQAHLMWKPLMILVQGTPHNKQSISWLETSPCTVKPMQRPNHRSKPFHLLNIGCILLLVLLHDRRDEQRLEQVKQLKMLMMICKGESYGVRKQICSDM